MRLAVLMVAVQERAIRLGCSTGSRPGRGSKSFIRRRVNRPTGLSGDGAACAGDHEPVSMRIEGMKAAGQTTLREPTTVAGVGVHSGLPVTLTLHPADANTGIVFRCGLEGRYEREIRADVAAVTATDFATVLGDESGPLVSTAEHVLSALRGLGIDNAVVELDGPEAPIMDGSAAPFVAAIDQVGMVTLAASRRYIRV